MGLFGKLFGKEMPIEAADDVIVAVCDGEMIPNDKIRDDVFAGNMMGKTIGIEPDSGEICSPANGTIEMVFPTGHAFGLRMSDGTGILIHIGIDTVEMNGKGFKAVKKQGDHVKAGETIIKVDLDAVKEANHPCTVMIIITEPVDEKSYDFIPYGKVKKAQTISK